MEEDRATNGYVLRKSGTTSPLMVDGESSVDVEQNYGTVNHVADRDEPTVLFSIRDKDRYQRKESMKPNTTAATEEARKVYHAVIMEGKKVFDAALDEADRAYADAMAEPRKAYAVATTEADRVLAAATVKPRKEFNAAMLAADKAYTAALVKPRKAWDAAAAEQEGKV